MIGISSFNRNSNVFGEDAHEYRPERWLEKDIDKGLYLAKGFTTWSSLLTFLGGPRGCIGYRFGRFSQLGVVKHVDQSPTALLEVNTIVAILIAAFEFLERDEGGTPLVKSFSIRET